MTMPRTARAILAASILLASAFAAEAQEGLAPRRIKIIKQSTRIPDMIPQVLYARLSAQNPLVVSGPGDRPQSTLILEYENGLTIILTEGGAEMETTRFPAAVLADAEAAAAAFDALAREWSALLGPVRPAEELDAQVLKMEKEAAFTEQLAVPFQLTLWLPISVRRTASLQSRESQWVWQWPLQADFSWHFTENFGVTASFLFEYGNYFRFAENDVGFQADAAALILMPGIGVQMRTVGRLSAELGLSIYFGAVNIRAEETAVLPTLARGESVWVFHPVLSLEPALVWSITPGWSMKLRFAAIALSLGRPADSAYGTALVLNLAQLGVSYRW